jgi:hypothetical protein
MARKTKVHICIDTVENGWMAQVKTMPDGLKAMEIALGSKEDVERAIELMMDAKGKTYSAPTFDALMAVLFGLSFAAEDRQGKTEQDETEIMRRMVDDL